MFTCLRSACLQTALRILSNTAQNVITNANRSIMIALLSRIPGRRSVTSLLSTISSVPLQPSLSWMSAMIGHHVRGRMRFKMKRTKNLQDLADTLSIKVFGGSLSEAHKNGKCVQCKKPKGEVRDELSFAEYKISGLCSICQDKIFG